MFWLLMELGCIDDDNDVLAYVKVGHYNYLYGTSWHFDIETLRQFDDCFLQLHKPS